jgi:hypothetical protein
VFFQAREAANPFYAAVPGTVQAKLDALAARTGRRYGLVDYAGAPDAERVLVLMGSAAGAAAEAVEALTTAGEKVGLVTVRLYRPFPAEALAAALPATVRRLAGSFAHGERWSVEGVGIHRVFLGVRGVGWGRRPAASGAGLAVARVGG